MRKAAAALFLCALAVAMAAEEAKPITVALEPLGDTDGGVATRVVFRFAKPPEVPPGAEMLLQGSFIRDGVVLRNFRIAVASEEHGPVRTIQTFPEGPLSIEVRLIMPIEEGAPVLIAKTTESFTVAKTNQAWTADEADSESIVAEGVVPESTGAVRIRAPRRDVAPNLFIVNVDVEPPVKRVEFWVEGKKILARNSPPYSAELDLGTLPKRVEVRAVGYDAKGRYVDADAFVVNERSTPLEVKITRTETSDGVSHIKLSVQNPSGTNLRTVALYADDRKLQEWTHPPYAIDLPTSQLAGVNFVRAEVVDSTGYEATDVVFLSGEHFGEEMEVNLVELPVTVSDPNGVPITNLTQPDFTIFENGIEQKISSFNFASNLPISVGVLLDHSASMEGRMEQAKGAALSFFRSILRRDDRAFIAPFANDPARNAPFVSSIETLETQVNSMPKAAGGTSLYDAVVTGLYRFRGVQGRRALIIITDGEDTTSRLSYEDMLLYARASRVPLYFVGVGFLLGDLGGPGKMKDLAAETGGRAYFIRSVKDLPEIYKRLETDLRSQYLLTYHAQSSKKDQTYRTIDVKVNRPDANVRTIRGYIP